MKSQKGTSGMKGGFKSADGSAKYGGGKSGTKASCPGSPRNAGSTNKGMKKAPMSGKK